MRLEYNEIEKYISKEKVKYNEPLAKYTTLKVGGPADVIVFPEAAQDIIKVLEFAKENNIHITVIGNGSKVLIVDQGIRGIVIKLTSKFSHYEIDGEYITVEAGMPLPKLAILAKDAGLSGLEFASGIPGNIGGAIYMNAGAYNGSMEDLVIETTYLDKDLNIRTLNHDAHNFSYRTSYFKQNADEQNIILSTKLKLHFGNKEEIAELMKTNNESRSSKQPLEYPNAGSTFKRPEGYFVGKLIDDLGLKGYKIGGAQVSTKHSGFIVNTGNATAKDVLDLIEYIKEKVLEANNLKLEEEIIVLGGEK